MIFIEPFSEARNLALKAFSTPPPEETPQCYRRISRLGGALLLVIPIINVIVFAIFEAIFGKKGNAPQGEERILSDENAPLLANRITQEAQMTSGDERAPKVAPTVVEDFPVSPISADSAVDASSADLEVDFTRMDGVSLDPFKVREARTCLCQCPALPDPNNESEMSAYLTRFDRTGLGKRPYVCNKGLPELNNYVWVGSQLKNPIFRENVLEWANCYAKNGAETVIWTDQTEFDEEMILWCRKYDIRLVNIHDALPREAWFGMQDAFELQRSKMFPNWGEASDILRYVLLYNFGGRYADTDTPWAYIDHTKATDMAQKSGLVLELSGTEQLPNTNDCFVSKPKHPFFGMVLQELQVRYSQTTQVLHQRSKDEQNDVNPNSSEIADTVARTGPNLVSFVFKQFCEGESITHEEKTNYRLPTRTQPTCTGSWLQKSVPKVLEPLTQLQEQRIMTELFWDLKSSPEKFDLNKFEPWIMASKNPDEFRASLYHTVKEQAPQLLKEVKSVEVKDPALFDMIFKDLALKPAEMGIPFLWAAFHGHIEMLNYLYAINPMLIEYSDGKTGSNFGHDVLGYALNRGSVETLEFILARYKGENHSLREKKTATDGSEVFQGPILTAISNENYPLIRHYLTLFPDYYFIYRIQIKSAKMFNFFLKEVWKSIDKVPFEVLDRMQAVWVKPYLTAVLEEFKGQPDKIKEHLEVIKEEIRFPMFKEFIVVDPKRALAMLRESDECPSEYFVRAFAVSDPSLLREVYELILERSEDEMDFLKTVIPTDDKINHLRYIAGFFQTDDGIEILNKCAQKFPPTEAGSKNKPLLHYAFKFLYRGNKVAYDKAISRMPIEWQSYLISAQSKKTKT